jgi:hypothetical protein
MRKIITFISFLFVALLGYAQQGNVLYTLKATPNKVLADHFGHIYLIQNARLILLDEKGKEKASYSNLSLGNISSADVSNPTRIMLWYAMPNQLVFLDRNLTALEQPSKLDNTEIINMLAVCNAIDASFWALDGQLQQLKCFNRNHSLLFSSGSLDYNPLPTWDDYVLIETNNGVLLHINGQGSYLFDKYGSFITLLPQSKPCRICSTGDEMVVAIPGKVYGIDLGTWQNTFSFETPENEQWTPLSRTCFAVQHGNELKIISLNK